MIRANPNFANAALAATLLFAASALLAACDQVVTSAHAQDSAPAASARALYIGDEYRAVQKALPADTSPQPATF